MKTLSEIVDQYREMLKNTPCNWKVTFYRKQGKVKVQENGRDLWSVYNNAVEFEKFCIDEINFWLKRAKVDKVW